MPSLLFVYALNVCLVEACFCLHADVGGKEWLKPQAGWIELSSEIMRELARGNQQIVVVL